MPEDNIYSNQSPATSLPLSADQPASSSQAQEPSPSLRAKVTEDMDAAQRSLKAAASDAAEKAKSTASGQVNFVARQVQGIAQAFEKAGVELEGSEHAEVGRYTRQLGQSVEGFAKKMEDKDIGEIASMAERFGRQQPLAFLGVAALAGLAASRFLTASATRAAARPTDTTESSSNSTRSGGVGHG